MGIALCSWSLMAAIATAQWPDDFGPDSRVWDQPVAEMYVNNDWASASMHDRIRLRMNGMSSPECAQRDNLIEACC